MLYTGYAKTFQRSPISLQDAIQLIVQAEHERVINCKEIDSFIDGLIQDLPHLVPDASTLQAVRARRWKKVKITPYKLLDIICDKVERHFPIESFDWSKRIRDPVHIKIAPETGIPVKTAAQLLVCSFVCEILNYSDVWIRGNWGLHFHKGGWPQIEGPYSSEPEWDGHSTLKKEVHRQLKV